MLRGLWSTDQSFFALFYRLIIMTSRGLGYKDKALAFKRLDPFLSFEKRFGWITLTHPYFCGVLWRKIAVHMNWALAICLYRLKTWENFLFILSYNYLRVMSEIDYISVWSDLLGQVCSKAVLNNTWNSLNGTVTQSCWEHLTWWEAFDWS